MAGLSPLFNLAIVPARGPRPVPALPAVIQAPPPPPAPAPQPTPVTGSGGTPIVCPVGTEWDPYQQACVAVTGGMTTGGTFPTATVSAPGVTVAVPAGAGAETGGGEGPITVNVANAVNVTDASAQAAIQNVASAVRGGIISGINGATASTNAQIQAVQYGIDNLTTQLAGGIDQAFGSISGVISGTVNGIQNALGGIGTVIGNSIFNAINPVSAGLAQIVQILVGQIGGLGGAIAGAVAQIIPQIIAAISNPLGALRGVLQSIESDIGTNLRDLITGPNIYGGAIGGLDATLGRIFTDYTSFTENQSGYPDGGNLHHDLSSISKAVTDALAGITAKVTGFNPKLSDKLTTLCKGVDLDAALNKPVWDTSQPLWGLIPDYHKIVADIIIWIFSVLPAVQKITEETRQRMDQACPIDLLPPPVLIDAWQRGYISEQQAIDEAGKGNLGESRLHLLKDLATQQLPVAQLIEALYRGIVSDSDFVAALAAQGYTGPQQAILQALGVSLLTVSEGLELLRRQSIDAPTLDKILSSHAYDDAQRKALASLAFRPQNIREAASGEASQRGLAAVGLGNEPDIFTAPEFIQRAGSAEGLDFDATTANWLSHWNIGSLNNWVSLYFRGQITFQQLEAVAARDFIPASILPALIDSQRPLVQFRTIATALRANIIDESNARLLLAQHGYSQNSIDVLIAYAKRPGPNKAAKNAAALHAVSLGIAKEEYIDGSITGDQYLAILTQHGYTLDGANTELQVVNAHQALLRRKEQAQLVIDEYGAGLIDEQAALAQLAVLGLTVDELARAAHKIRAFRAKTAKHPSEPDLHHFLLLQIITPDDYVAELKAQGYASKWAQAFLAWRQAPSTPPVVAVTPAPSTP